MKQKPICAQMNEKAEVKNNNKKSERGPACVSECSRVALLVCICLLICLQEIQPPELDMKMDSQTKSYLFLNSHELSSQSPGD